MRRRSSPAELLPLPLRTFDPLRWLEAGEDPADPGQVHVRALSRYRDAVRAATNAAVAEDVAGPVIEEWYGPRSTRAPGVCPCRVCP